MTPIEKAKAQAEKDTWDSFCFPKWVPLEVRRELRSFWAEHAGRTPREWFKYTALDPYYGQPLMGTMVTCGKGVYLRRKRRGRWVPMWNNIGRLVTADGTVFVLSTGDIVRRGNLI